MGKYYDDMQVSFSSDNKEEIIIHDSWIPRRYIFDEESNKEIMLLDEYSFTDKEIRETHMEIAKGKEVTIKYDLCPKYPDNQPIGKLLMDFLDTDFETFDGFIKFFENYGVKGLCDISERAKVESIVLLEVMHGSLKYEKADYIQMMTEIWNETKEYLRQAQMDFKVTVSYCYNFDEYDFLKNLTPAQRFYVASMSKQREGLGEGLLPYTEEIEVYFDMFPIGEQIGFKKYDHEELANMILENKSRIHYSSIFKSSNITNICYVILQHILKNDIQIVKCQNCGKYFIPVSKSDEIFCERMYDGKTCREIGPGKKRNEKIKNSPALKEYYKAYKRNYARRISKKISLNDFINWTDRAKMLMQEAEKGNLTLEEFIERLKE